MPAIERAPDPRPNPSSTVSAWSSSVCANNTGASVARGVERQVAGRARGGLGTAGSPDLDAKHLSVNASQRHRLIPCGRRHPLGVGLQAMVDDQRRGRHDRGRNGGERQRVGSAGQRDTPAVRRLR